MNVSGLPDDYNRIEKACLDAENEVACSAVDPSPETSSQTPPEPSPSNVAPGMAPESEEATASIIENDLDPIMGNYGDDEDSDDDESPSSDRNQPLTESSPSPTAGSLFNDLFGK